MLRPNLKKFSRLPLLRTAYNQTLSLSNNTGITGDLDALAGLTNLQVLSLANLSITGTLPAALQTRMVARGGSVDLLGNPSVSACALSDNNADCAAVVVLTGPTGAWSSIWPASQRGTSYCDWPGVGCSANGRLTQLSLASMGLAGSIPPSLGSLTRLQKLDLSGNGLTGQIPDSFAAPAMNALQTLLLDSNRLSGTLPAALKALAAISNWSFFGNQFSDCGLKDNSADCAALLQVAASPWGVWAGLTGYSYCDWPGITCASNNRAVGLDLSGAGLGATIPVAISSLSALTTLSLRNNLIGGGLPASLASLSALQVLLLDNNALTGTVPVSTLPSSSSTRSAERLASDAGRLPPMRLLRRLSVVSADRLLPAGGMVAPSPIPLRSSPVTRLLAPQATPGQLQ